MTLLARLENVPLVDQLTKRAPLALPRVAGLDELRGCCILWVMWCHSTSLWTWLPSEFAGYGYHGVLLFFMISGYLITQILLRTEKKDGYFRAFYINRIMRIWPLMLLALCVSAFIDPSLIQRGIYNLLMINNFTYAYGIEPMVRTDVMWSLAIEEQFYLVWPLVVFLLPRKLLAPFMALLVVIGLSVDAGLIPHGAGIVFKTTQGNMQYIAMGALIAFGRGGIKWALAAWGSFLIFYLARNGVAHGLENFRWVWYGISFALMCLVIYTIERKPLFQWSPIAYVGKICFGLYIIHFFISWSTLSVMGPGVWLPGTIYLLVSLALSVLSFSYYERPLLDLRRKIIASPKASTALLGGLAVIALLGVISMVPLLGLPKH